MSRAASMILRGSAALALAFMLIGTGLVSAGPIGSATGQTDFVTPDMSAVEYTTANGEPLLLDVYKPANGDSPAPAIIFVHGGAFRLGHRGAFRLEASRAVKRGWIAITIDYRLDETPGHPGAVEDVRAAVSWARQNADDLGLDPDRIVLYGSSAGGTLASEAAVMTEGPLHDGDRVLGVVAFSGPMDLTAIYEDTAPRGAAAKIVTDYLGCVPEECQDLYRDASPITHVSADDPPHFLAQSTDEVIPANQGSSMQSALQSVGVAAELQFIEGNLHARALSRETPGLMDAAFDFMEGLVGGRPADQVPPPSTPDSTLESDPAGAPSSLADSAAVDESASEGWPLATWIMLGVILAAGLLGGVWILKRDRTKT